MMACSTTLGQALIGQKVSVFDSVEFTWCDGLVQEYDSATKLHKVVRDMPLFVDVAKSDYKGRPMD